MAIENRNLEVGTRLVANYKKQTYVCTVEAGEGDEGVAFVLGDGKRFKSPSAAGSSVMGGVACNGWRFWTVEGEQATLAVDAAQSAPKERKAGGTRTRTKKAAAEAPQPEVGDYLIDSDGRPINQDETSAAVEGGEGAAN